MNSQSYRGLDDPVLALLQKLYTIDIHREMLSGGDPCVLIMHQSSQGESALDEASLKQEA